MLNENLELIIHMILICSLYSPNFNALQLFKQNCSLAQFWVPSPPPAAHLPSLPILSWSSQSSLCTNSSISSSRPGSNATTSRKLASSVSPPSSFRGNLALLFLKSPRAPFSSLKLYQSLYACNNHFCTWFISPTGLSSLQSMEWLFLGSVVSMGDAG